MSAEKIIDFMLATALAVFGICATVLAISGTAIVVKLALETLLS